MIKFTSAYTRHFQTNVLYHFYNFCRFLSTFAYAPLLTVILLPAYPEQSADPADT